MSEPSSKSQSARSSQSTTHNPHKVSQRSWYSRSSTWICKHTSSEDLKILFRCSFSAWVTMILVFITPSLKLLGSAAFFGAIVQFFFPPAGVVLVQVLVVATMIIGIGIAWGWGAITMKAALAVRSNAETQAALKVLETNAVALSKTSHDTVKRSAQRLLLDGAMLDTRVSTVYFVLGLVFIYFIARLQQKSQALVLLSFFAMIITDVFMTTGPLLFNFQGMLPKVLILPSALSMAISIGSAILIFPRTTSYLILSDIKHLIDSLKTSLDTFQGAIENHPELPPAGALRKNKTAVFSHFNKFMMKCFFLPFDISVGRFSPEDILSLQPLLRRLVIATDALNTLYNTRSKAVTMLQKQQQQVDEGGSKLDASWKASSVAHHHDQAMFDFLEHMKHEDSQVLTAKTIATLREPSQVLLEACRTTFDDINETITAVNDRRWFNTPSASSCSELGTKHVANLERLKKVKQEFKGSTRENLIAPYTDLFDENGELVVRGKNAAAMHSLVLSMNLVERLLRVASATEIVLARIMTLQKEKTKSRLWLPKMLTGLLSRSSKSPSTEATPADDDNSSSVHDNHLSEKSTATSQIKPEDKATKREHKLTRRAVTAPIRRGSKFGRLLVDISQWFSNQTGIFALRMTIVSFALAVPAVIPSSAGFYYREKGLWALIMAQTGLTIYMADLVVGIAGRFAFCVIGGVLGLAAWYIGSGSGTGNPYGLAAICIPCIVFLMFFRLHAPKSWIPLSVIGASTFVLIVGYSYIDTHIDVYENPGYGYTVFWHRTLLVMVGYVAAIIVQCFPAAPSATQHVADNLSANLDSVSVLYIKIVNSWLAVADDVEATDMFSFDAYHLGKPEQGQEYLAHKTAMKIMKSLASLGLAIKTVAYEPSVLPFTSTKLAEIHALMYQIVEIESQLLGQMESLKPEFRLRFKNATSALNEALVADVVAVLAMVSSSLRTGAPLPALMPTPLLARSYGLAAWKGIGTLELQTLQDPSWPAYSLLTTGYVALLNRVDELVVAVKEAVGESHHVQGEIESGSWGFGYLKSSRSDWF